MMEEENKAIIDFCKKYGIDKYEINWGILDVFESVKIHDNKLTRLPFKFGTVVGDFVMTFCTMTDLENCPTTVTGVFDCSHCGLTSLYGIPESVGGYCSVENNKLTTIDDFPSAVAGVIYLHDNPFIQDDAFYNKLVSFIGFNYVYTTPVDVGDSLLDPLKTDFLSWYHTKMRRETIQAIVDQK